MGPIPASRRPARADWGRTAPRECARSSVTASGGVRCPGPRTRSGPQASAIRRLRLTARLSDALAFAQVGIVGPDGRIELEALRLYGLPVGQREFAVETSVDLPSIGGGAARLLDVALTGAR
jgi:hypothetical protein